MGTSRWTPALGTGQLVARFGRDRAFEVLTQFVSKRVRTQAMLRPPYAEAIRCIGQCDAGALLGGGGAEHLSYWPRSWAARALGYVGDDDADATVRRQADRALARVERRIAVGG